MKKTLAKKAQIITFDLSSSLIIFLIFIAIFVGLFFLAQKSGQEQEFEIDYVLANLENNLKYDSTPNRDFIRDYRVNREKLDNFASSVSNIDSYVLGTIGDAHGIGIDNQTYDVCLYFRDIDGTIMILGGGIRAVGELSRFNPARSCDAEISAGRNPCDNYKQAVSLFKPVLLEEGGANENRIIQMNLVLCRR